MVRTQIQLTEEQMTALEALAKQRHLSLVALIQEGIDQFLRSAAGLSDAERRQRALGVAGRFKSGLGDLAKHHDDYLAEA